MFYSGTLLGVGTQLLCMGILAEMVTAYNIRESDTFSVAETLDTISDRRSPIPRTRTPRSGCRRSGPHPARSPGRPHQTEGRPMDPQPGPDARLRPAGSWP